ncbi:RelA/SpoT domain-containing protein [Aliarcobacter cryaerophilus]|uniref:RelA/SpoT domain-containing protein n=1 Tax=Aliarcobacter cryaerophilus TaxID=28198 RepID=UPI0021B5443D|nr:RelA/SpoT domain-containing protein [Aliarcobacter cryaerophilus]MCT7406639.1 RelA/SpoT domain-containing protein [Aliarcobacter cryaerophilus]MCT7504375.1 RelA/SpoT domain-containing protein [Aliarcobacter cryaerophilus]
MEILSYWRTSHASALESAFDLLENITNKIDKYALLAKRLKRTPSIVNKLKRFNSKGMQLSTMQDIGGCRIILSNLKNVDRLIKTLKKERLFELRNDYIRNPKEDGYKSIHLIGKFKNSEGELRSIELQIRTKVQHSWATAVEIVDLFTNQSLKSNSGKTIWKDFFKHTSEQFALLENSLYLNSSENNNLIFRDFLEEFKKLNKEYLKYSIYKVFGSCNKLNIIKNFTLFTNSLQITSEQLKNNTSNGYILIIIETIEGNTFGINSIYYNENEVVKANYDYLMEEKKSFQNHNIVALVSTNAIGGVQEAYPNYFADSKDFIKYLQIINLSYNTLNPGIFKLWNSLLYKFKKPLTIK